jgi:phage-related protein
MIKLIAIVLAVQVGVSAGGVAVATLVGSRIMMLHQFVKKSEKTSRKELAIARRRMKEVKDVQDS